MSITLNMVVFKSIIEDLNHGDKLSEKNYDNMKICYSKL